MSGSEGAKLEPVSSTPSNSCDSISFEVYVAPNLERTYENLANQLEDSPTDNDGEGVEVDSSTRVSTAPGVEDRR
jgi:hypothetical protein